MGVVAETITATDRLRTVPESEYGGSLARLYHVVNVAHPFREGNGRTQREFITALAAESGHTVDWTRVTGRINDLTSMRARQGGLGPLIGMFQTVVDKPTPTALPPSVGAAFPDRATQATGYAGDPGHRLCGRPAGPGRPVPAAGAGEGRRARAVGASRARHHTSPLPPIDAELHEETRCQGWPQVIA